jgi:hypothetical protein
MAELVNEVKFDFSGAAMLAGHLQRAQRYSGLISKDMQDATRAARDGRLTGNPGGIAGSGHPAGVSGGMSAGAQFAAMAGAAAGGSAFFYRSTALANPAATQRFHDALDDMTAVIGHQLVPALKEMTTLVRQFADFLANNPMISKGIGYGVIGATALGTAGLGFNAARGIYSGVRAGAGLAGRVFGYGGSGAATGEIGAASEVAAVGRFGGLGRLGGRLGGAASRGVGGPVAIASAGLELSAAQTPNEALDSAASIAMLNPFLPQPGNIYNRNVSQGNRNALERNFERFTDFNSGLPRYLGAKYGIQINPFQSSTQRMTVTANKSNISSFGAAARPAEYQDILGSVMSMRQSIVQGGRDPMEDLASSSNTTAANTTQLLQIARNNGEGTDRGTSR